MKRHSRLRTGYYFIGLLFIGMAMPGCQSDDSDKTGIDLPPSLRTLGESDHSCLEDLTLQVSGSTVNAYSYFESCVLIANDIVDNAQTMYYCPCNEDCQAQDEFSSLYAAQTSNISTGPAYDITMGKPCADFIYDPGVTLMCDDDYAGLYTYLYNVMQNAKDSMYMTQDELDLCREFLTVIYNRPETVDFCYFRDQWDNADKLSDAPGIVSGMFITAIPVVVKNRLAIWGSGPDLDDTAEWYGIKIAATFWASCMWSCYSKGCSGLQESDAGNMMMSDAAHDAAVGL